MSRARDLLERRHEVVARGVGQFAGDTTAESASNATITDVDGRTLLDFAGGIAVADVRGLGAMISVEFRYGGDPRKPADDLVKRVTAMCRDNSVAVLPASPYGNVLRVLSPLVISDEDLNYGLDVMEAAVFEAAAKESQT